MPYLKDRDFDKHHPDTDHLYSGRGRNDVFFIDKIRTNRAPKDTPQDIHEDLDDAFNKKFGINARSNSLFCTGDISQASGYGKVYIIFPQGSYNVIWNDDVSDLFMRLKYIYRNAVAGSDSDFELGDDISYVIRREYSDDMQSSVWSRGEKEYEKYYGEDTKGGVWIYTYDHYDAEELEKMGVKKGHKRDIFIKGFTKEKIKDMLHNKYGSLFPDNLIWSPDLSRDDFQHKVFDKYEREYWTKKIKEVHDDIDREIKNLINSYNKGDVSGAIDSRNEVMLSSNQGYCALEATKSVYNPIFHFFKAYGYHHPEDIKRKIGQDKWSEFKESSRFESKI
jgi:hypothetical protein